MAKIIFENGREIPVSFFGEAYGFLDIFCSLPMAEAFELFSNPENIKKFTYVEDKLDDDGNPTERRAEVTRYNVFVGIENISDIFGPSDDVRVKLRSS